MSLIEKIDQIPEGWHYRDRLHIYYSIIKFLREQSSQFNPMDVSSIMQACSISGDYRVRVIGLLVSNELVCFIKNEPVRAQVYSKYDNNHAKKSTTKGWFFATEKGIKFMRLYEQMIAMLPGVLDVDRRKRK